jgi:hypothetical protein
MKNAFLNLFKSQTAQIRINNKLIWMSTDEIFNISNRHLQKIIDFDINFNTNI